MAYSPLSADSSAVVAGLSHTMPSGPGMVASSPPAWILWIITLKSSVSPPCGSDAAGRVAGHAVLDREPIAAVAGELGAVAALAGGGLDDVAAARLPASAVPSGTKSNVASAVGPASPPIMIDTR